MASSLSPTDEVEVPHIEVDEETKDVIRELLSQMRNSVELLFFTSKSCGGRSTNWCVPTEELIDLLRELAPRDSLLVRKFRYEEDPESFRKYGVEEYRVPVIYLLNGSIRYLGAPMGEEVRAFIETIVRISTGETRLRPRTKDELRALSKSNGKRVEVITIVTPTCPYCPYAVLTANMFAYESNGKVISEVVEANEQMDIADLYQVTAVPAVALKAEDQDVGNIEFIGVPPEADLLRKIIMYSNQGLR